MVERLLPHEVARMLGVTPERVRQLCNEGRLPAERGLFNTRLIPRQAVERLIEERSSRRAGAGRR